MRRFLAALASVALLMSVAWAEPPDRRFRDRKQPAAQAAQAQQPAQKPAPQPTQQPYQPRVRGYILVPTPVNPYAPGYYADPYGQYGPYGYDPYYGYGPPAYVPYSGPVILPPVYMPAETMYGPDAVKRFLGGDLVSPSVRSSGSRSGAAIRSDGDSAPDRPEKPSVARSSNPESQALGRRFLTFGDNHFAKHKYNDAYTSYKKAAQAAPGIAESHFRQGYALVAAGRYELAVKAFKRGLELDPAWPNTEFRVDTLYGDNAHPKAVHVNELAQAADRDPMNGDLQFLLGIYAHFDGQADRAAQYFARAVQLAHGHTSHLKPFMGERENPAEEDK